MSDDEYDRLAARVAALERALTEDADVATDSDRHTASNSARVDSTGERLAAMEADLVELEAALLAVRGYVGRVRHVNREVERTAERALATAERAAEGGRPPANGNGDGESGPLVAPSGDPLDALDGPDPLDAATDGPPDGSASPPPDGDDPDAGGLLARVRGAL